MLQGWALKRSNGVMTLRLRRFFFNFLKEDVPVREPGVAKAGEFIETSKSPRGARLFFNNRGNDLFTTERDTSPRDGARGAETQHAQKARFDDTHEKKKIEQRPLAI